MKKYYQSRVWFTRLAESYIQMKYLSQKAGARFLSDDEIKLIFSSWNKGLIINGKNLRMSEKDSFANLAVFAKSGVGKTSSISFPNIIDLAERDCSLALNDPKGELYDALSGYLKYKGFHVIKYDIMEVTNHDSHFFNPFAFVQDDVELDFICDLIINVGNPSEGKSQIFNNGAIKLIRILAKCLSYGDPKKYNLPELYSKLREFGSMGEGLKKWIYENSQNPQTGDRETYHEWVSFLTGNEEGVMSFVLTAQTSLRQLANDNFRSFYSDNSFDLNSFRKQKTAVFYVTPPDKQQYFSFSTSIFFRTLFSISMRKQYLDENKFIRPFYCIYDEFGNSYVPSFQDIITTSRAYKISCTIILQSITQLESKYGKVDAKTIIDGGFSTYMTLHSGNHETNKFFEELGGKVVETKRRDVYDHRSERVEYNLVNQDEIRRMADDQALIVYKNKQAMQIRLLPHYKNKKFRVAKEFGRLRVKLPPRHYLGV
ncbi:MAG: type IV secretory system conjugative DNA transfer family protein [Arenicella sp.]